MTNNNINIYDFAKKLPKSYKVTREVDGVPIFRTIDHVTEIQKFRRIGKSQDDYLLWLNRHNNRMKKSYKKYYKNLK